MKTRDDLLIEQALKDTEDKRARHSIADERLILVHRVLELERSGWQPPTDPDLIEAREMVISELEGKWPNFATKVRMGLWDVSLNIHDIQRGIKRGRELERNGK